MGFKFWSYKINVKDRKGFDTKVKSEDSTYHNRPRFEVEEEEGRTVPGSDRSFAGQPEVQQD